MNSAFERLQKLAEEKRLKENGNELNKITTVSNSSTPSFTQKSELLENHSELRAVSAPRLPRAVSAPKNNLHPTSPDKDFTKVANSIVRRIPDGIFSGKSKQMYDYLYSLTRGAISPRRETRISKASLMKGSGIKSTHTFYNNVRHLEEVGLIKSTRIDGEKGGNLYEVLLPEEIDDDLAQLAQLAHPTQLAQKLPVAASAETALAKIGLNLTKTTVSDDAKTYLKTNTNIDDERIAEIFSLMSKRFDVAVLKLTGKKSSRSEAEKWASLADLLILELEKAAKNTNSISSVPAFLTEVLRRQFFASNQAKPKSSKHAAKSFGKTKTDLIGKSDEESFAIKPLDEQGREEALAQLQDFAEDDFLESFKKWYTEDDWRWLTEKLKEN